ncbi:uncharacterized protein LOC141580845 isoform X2 [Saimiri boliviensis]|uniref:uncharacterized protein LOC141580845 isoform X2 n=1 Tax=Saimiri boliviensis TaxID=27679 RepID=UPI003D78150B
MGVLYFEGRLAVSEMEGLCQSCMEKVIFPTSCAHFVSLTFWCQEKQTDVKLAFLVVQSVCCGLKKKSAHFREGMFNLHLLESASLRVPMSKTVCPLAHALQSARLWRRKVWPFPGS